MKKWNIPVKNTMPLRIIKGNYINPILLIAIFNVEILEIFNVRMKENDFQA